MPMPTYRNTNCSPLFALLGMALICGMLFAGSRVFKPAMIKLAGSIELREFEKAFREVQHPVGTERLSLRTSPGEFAGSDHGCDFYVGEVRRYDGNEEDILAVYADQEVSGNPILVVFLEGGQIPSQASDSIPEPLNNLVKWELPPSAVQQPFYMVFLVVIDYVGDLKLDCR